MRLLALLFTFFMLNAPLHAKGDAFPAQLPASYVGTLPCADCPGIDTRLNLLPDGQFQLRMTYQEREGAGFDQIGRWTSEKGMLVLKDGDRLVEQFKITGKTHELLKLDMQGQPIPSKLNYTLQRKNVYQPMKPRLTMQGLFSYFADSPRFTPCATNQSMPVRMEDDYLALERAYLVQRKQPGMTLLAEVDGQILRQPRLEGEGSEQALKVLKFIELSAVTACPASVQTGEQSVLAVTLEDLTWTLIQLGEQTITPPKDRLGAHILLMSKDQRVAGSGGCNRLMGGYTLDGNKLSFSKMASTMMACQDGMALEQAFLKALDTVASWNIEGNTLMLKDASAQVVARLSATL